MRLDIYKDQNSDLTVDVLCAVGSAILLSFTRVHPEFWFISLFALVPFLWRLRHISLRGAAALGMMLATFFVFLTSGGELLIAPKIFLLKLFSLNLAFALFGLAVHWTKKTLRFELLLVPLLWLPMEYALIRYAGLGSLFSVSGPTLLEGFPLLFGALLTSFIIILINSLTLMFLEYVKEKILNRKRLPTARDNKFCLLFNEIILERSWYNFPDIRSPP